MTDNDRIKGLMEANIKLISEKEELEAENEKLRQALSDGSVADDLEGAKDFDEEIAQARQEGREEAIKIICQEYRPLLNSEVGFVCNRILDRLKEKQE